MTGAEVSRSSRLSRVVRTAESVPVRVAITLVLLGIVAANINWSLMANRLSHGNPLDFAAAVLLVVAALLVGVCRWGLLLWKADLRLRPTSILRIYWIATFSNTFLPTSVGGDVTRTLLVARKPPLVTRSAMTVIVDRVGGLAGLLGMAWLAIILASAPVPSRAETFLAWVTAAVIAGALLVLLAVFRGSRLARALVPQRLVSAARDSRSLLQAYAREPLTLVLVLSSSLLYQALVSLQLVMLARSIDVNLGFATAAVVLALVTVVVLIPLSIGGFGIREGSYVVLLGSASIGATDAALISLLSVGALFLASLPGAFLLARTGLGPALKAAPS